MDNNWYSNNDWYAPNYAQQTAHYAAEQHPKKRRLRRWLALAFCLLIVGAAVFIAFWGRGNARVSYSFDDFSLLPGNWKDYMNTLYKVSEYDEIYLDKTEGRDGLEVVLGTGTEGSELSLQEVYAKCSASVVSVKASGKVDGMYSWGTGIIISADGYIVTNTHIIEGCKKAEIGLIDGSTYEAKLVGADNSSDISLLKIDAIKLKPAEFATTNGLLVGDGVSAIGNPLGEEYKLTMTNGIISAISREVSKNGRTMKLLQTNAAINEGNSGGALINGRGQIIGITNMKIVSPAEGVEGIGFAIPSDTVREIVDRFINGTSEHLPMLGITVGPVSETVAEHYEIPQGLYVIEVQKASDAFTQGVEVSDIIIAANGRTISTNDELSAIKSELGIGDSMSLTIWRDGKTLEIEIELVDSALLD